MTFGSYASAMVGLPMRGPPLEAQSGVQPKLLVADDYTPGPTGAAANNRSEGSFLWKQDGRFYLFYSDGNCCAGKVATDAEVYKIKYCTAEAALGPYKDRNGTSCLAGDGGDLLMMSHGEVRAPGSVSIVDDVELGIVMVYQYQNASGMLGQEGITFGWNYLGFDANGTPVLSETRIKQTSSASPTVSDGSVIATATGSGAAASRAGRLCDVLLVRSVATGILLSLLSALHVQGL